MQSKVGTIQAIFRYLSAVVKSNVKATRDSDDELVACAQGVPGARLASWDIVEIEHSLNFKWNMLVGLDEAQVSSSIGDPGQVN